mgnify:CR=1 FL=1
MVERIGELTNRLSMPATSKVHLVFHILVLKDAIGNVDGLVQSSPLETTLIIPITQAFLERWILQGKTKVLVHWTNTSPSEAIWEDVERLAEQYPDFVDP